MCVCEPHVSFLKVLGFGEFERSLKCVNDQSYTRVSLYTCQSHEFSLCSVSHVSHFASFCSYIYIYIYALILGVELGVSGLKYACVLISDLIC